MPAQAICVDGPKRGETITLESAYQPSYVVPVPVPQMLEAVAEGGVAPDEPMEPVFKEVVYIITRFKLFGTWILVATTKEPPRDIDLWEALASKTAKDIALQ